MRYRFLLVLAVAWALSGCAAQSTQAPGAAAQAGATVDGADAWTAVVASPDRSEEDRQLDYGRQPAELLRFFQIGDGMRVAELGAGGGYTTELLARCVGATGVVFAQNSPLILQRFAEAPWSARLQKPLMTGVHRVDREFDDPLPEDATGLDAVLIVLFYHDTVWMN